MIELPAELRNYFGDYHGERDAFDAILNFQGKVFREHKNRKTLFIRKNGKGYFIKVHRGVGWKEILKNLLNLRLPVLGAQNEVRSIRRLEEIGVETMKMAGYGVRGLPPAWLDSFVITEELENTVSLEDFCRDWVHHPPEFRLKSAIILKVADIARRLHQNGLNHRDFYICHFLLETAGLDKEKNYGGLHIHLIDLHRMQIRRKTPHRWIIKDLSGLFFSGMDIGLTKRDVFRFMKAYTGKPLRDILKEQTHFWEHVYRRAVKLYERHFSRLPDIPDLKA